MFSDISVSDLVIVLVTMLVSLSVHEAMHAFTAHALGDTTAKEEGRLTLNPLKHIDIVTTVLLPVILIALHLPPIFIAKPVPFDPERVRYGEFGAALIALAGPLTNLVLAILAALFIHVGGLPWDSSTVYALSLFMQVNIAIFVFNMIPFPPLDGSRLVYAFAPEPVQRVMYRIESAGFALTVLIFLLLSPIIVPFVSNISQAIYTFLL
ncbi:MAG TPA: site-2 protease family protein [Candidatus Saccharimonadales bacterium]|nr:site-2 protease family protein [Candidatus Saccharimonadales bacterium]